MKSRDDLQKARDAQYAKNLEDLQEKNRQELKKLSDEMNSRCNKFLQDLDQKDQAHASLVKNLNDKHSKALAERD